MSVFRSKRQISKTEFENTFKQLYIHSNNQVNKLAKRRKKWLGKPIVEILNECFDLIVELNEDLHSRKCSEEESVDRIKDIIKKLYLLEKPMIVLWNIENYDIKKMVSWAEMLKNEIDVLLYKADIDREYKLMIIDKDKVKRIDFLNTMSLLHKYTHGKVVNAPMKYDDSCGSIIIRNIDDALYCVFKANERIPTTKNEYKKRQKYLDKAVTDLYRVQRIILSYFNLVGYSEETYSQWSGYVISELKLLNKLIKSDKARFSDLQ